LTNEFVFLDNTDFAIRNEDLNYSNLKSNDGDDEFKARIFAFKWGKENMCFKVLKPFTVTPGDEMMEKGWKNYFVLLMGEKGQNQVTKVCFPSDIQENFALVTNINNKCSNTVTKIKQYKILDTTESVVRKDAKKETKKPKSHKILSPKQLKILEKNKKYDQMIKDLLKETKKKHRHAKFNHKLVKHHHVYKHSAAPTHPLPSNAKPVEQSPKVENKIQHSPIPQKEVNAQIINTSNSIKFNNDNVNETDDEAHFLRLDEIKSKRPAHHK
jgi:hypothetical protein